MAPSDPASGNDFDQPPTEMHLPEASTRIRHNPRRKNPRAIDLLLKVVLGGLAGLVLGQLILWWLPRPFRRDPLELASRLPAAVSFLAPASLRHDTPEIANRPTRSTADHGAVDSTSVSSGEVAGASSLAELVEAAPRIPESPERQIGLADLPLIRLHQLEASLKHTSRSHDAFVAMDDWTASAVETWYADLCSLAHDVTFADTRESNIDVFAGEARKFLVRVAEDPRCLQAILDRAPRWIADANNHRRGILLVGTVTDISARGEMFQTELKLGADQAVNVMSRVDPRHNPRMTFFEGDRILIVGVVVTEPSLFLLGYHGDADAVVWGGMPVELPDVR